MSFDPVLFDPASFEPGEVTGTVSFPERSYAVGSRQLGPVNVPDGASLAVIRFGRSAWTDPGVRLNARLELSLDGGVTWCPSPNGQASWPWGVFPVKFSAGGGVRNGPDGNPSTETIVRIPIPEPNNPDRKVRVSMVVSGGDLTTAISVEVT